MKRINFSCWSQLQHWAALSPSGHPHPDRPMKSDRPDLWSQNSSGIPRLEVDLRGSRRRQPQQFCSRFR